MAFGRGLPRIAREPSPPRLAQALALRLVASSVRNRSANSSPRVGSKYAAASAQTSRTAGTADAITGQPQAMASSGGMPKPSYSDGKTKQVACWYSALSSASDT